jgi:hypothetical protein
MYTNRRDDLLMVFVDLNQNLRSGFYYSDSELFIRQL